MRGRLVPPVARIGDREVRVPLSHTRSERFDELVRDVIAALEERFADRLAGVEFAVEDVPQVGLADEVGVVADETAGGPVPLGRLLAAGQQGPARVVVYRRPLEARAANRTELSELVREVVVEQVAGLLGMDPDEVDPP